MIINEHLNHALVEESRPPMYKAMKYWGKKPHNIWKEFIECYCPENGIVLDPFAGSGVAAFESAASNRKAIAFDINPMSAFFIEVMTSDFDQVSFCNSAQEILDDINSDPIYKEHYNKQYAGHKCLIYNYIWKDNTIWKINAKDENDAEVEIVPDDSDYERAINMDQIQIRNKVKEG